ncbi:MAG: MinD/ParA family protein [Pseudomonadota bacterium]
MTSVSGRLLGRTLRDVTTVRAEDLHLERVLEPSPLSIVPRPNPAKSQVICVASGKGGTGKTVVTTNLAVLLAQEGFSVLLFDADMGLANAHLLLGVSPANDITSVLDGRMKLTDIICECSAGVRLVSGGSGFSELSELKDRELRHLASELKACEEGADIILVDLSAGISPQVMRFLRAAHDVILVTTPDVTAMLDAYATIKSLAEADANVSVKLVVNRARQRSDAVAAFKKIKAVASRHLTAADISFFGWVPHNWYIQDSVDRRQPVVTLHPRSFVTLCLKHMAGRIGAEHAAWKLSCSAAPSFSSRLERVVFE